MRTIKKPKCAAILERDPGLFSEKVNALIDTLAEAGAEIDKPQPYRTADGFFCAVVNYTEILKVYDNVKEEYQDRGEVYFCIDCPLYRPQTDGRRKGGYCARKSFVADGATACKRFIKIMDKEGRDWIASKKVHMLIDLAYDGRATAVLISKEREETS